jgi:hypothetical protein
MTLIEEAARATEMLKGKVVENVWRHREGEFGIQFTDGTRVFVDAADVALEVSIT